MAIIKLTDSSNIEVVQNGEWISLDFASGGQVDQNTSDIATNATNIQNLQPAILFNNVSNTYQSSITLSDDTSNYTFLEVFYYYYGQSSMKIDVGSSNGSFSISQIALNSGYIFWVDAQWDFTGNSMTLRVEERWRLGTTGSGQRTTSPNNLIIQKVIGYK